MDKQLIVNSKDKSKYYLVDIVEKKCYLIARDTCKISKYTYDTVELKDSIGTIAYLNTDINAYGILKERKNSVGICWINRDIAENDIKFSLLANNNNPNNVLDVTSYGSDVLNSNWCGKLQKSIIARNLNFLPMRREEFEELLNPNTEVDEVDNLEECSEEPEEVNTTSIDMSGLFNDYMKSLEERLADIIKREEAVALKEIELTKKSNRLNKLLVEYDGRELQSMAETIVAVGYEVDNCNSVNNTPDFNFSTYEYILKVLDKNNYISIPKELYSKFKIKVLKNLDFNMAYTRYTVLATLKFNDSDKNSIVGIIDYNEESSLFYITILDKYGLNNLSNTDIQNYILDYTNWKKNRFLGA